MTNKYKLRIYKLSAPNKGDLDHEEFFSTRELMTVATTNYPNTLRLML